VGNRKKYGLLAKPPRYGEWPEERLKEIERVPIKPLSWLLGLIEKLVARKQRPVQKARRVLERPRS
jgi:hypothetical protein